MLELGENAARMAGTADCSLRSLYYIVMRLLLLRNEFALENLLARPADPVDRERLKVGSRFRALLLRLLRHCVEKLMTYAGGDLTEEQNNFLETVAAVAFFRIPEFRSKLLSALEKSPEASPHLPNFATHKLFSWEALYQSLPDVPAPPKSRIGPSAKSGTGATSDRTRTGLRTICDQQAGHVFPLRLGLGPAGRLPCCDRQRPGSLD